MNTIIIPILPVNLEIESIAVECLERVHRFSKDFHLVSIVNGMEGGSPKFQRQIKALSNEFVLFNNRLGYAKAVNEGLARLHPKSTHVTVGSCDIYVAENWQWAFAGNNNFKDDISDHFVSPYDLSKTLDKDVGYRGEFWAAWWTMPQSAVDILGPLDEQFNLRFAANDYAIRAYEAGFQFTRANITFDHVAAKHSSVGNDFRQAIRKEEREFRAMWKGAYNYKSWVERAGMK